MYPNESKKAKEAHRLAIKLKKILNRLENTTLHELREELDETILDVVLLENKVEAIANLFNIVFDADGNIVSESYNEHKHNYKDDNGAGIENKTTDGIK